MHSICKSMLKEGHGTEPARTLAYADFWALRVDLLSPLCFTPVDAPSSACQCAQALGLLQRTSCARARTQVCCAALRLPSLALGSDLEDEEWPCHAPVLDCLQVAPFPFPSPLEMRGGYSSDNARFPT
jgi:hypothetical protein